VPLSSTDLQIGYHHRKSKALTLKAFTDNASAIRNMCRNQQFVGCTDS